MPVVEFLERIGDRGLGEMSYRVAIAEDMEMTLDELETRMPAPELEDWILLYDVEAEAREIEVVNASRRPRRK